MSSTHVKLCRVRHVGAGSAVSQGYGPPDFYMQLQPRRQAQSRGWAAQSIPVRMTKTVFYEEYGSILRGPDSWMVETRRSSTL